MKGSWVANVKSSSLDCYRSIRVSYRVPGEEKDRHEGKVSHLTAENMIEILGEFKIKIK